MAFDFFNNLIRRLRRKKAVEAACATEKVGCDENFLQREKLRLNNIHLYGSNVFAVGDAFVFAGRLDLGTLGVCYGMNVHLDFPVGTDETDVEEALERWRMDLIRYGHELKNYLLLKALSRYYDTKQSFWTSEKMAEAGVTSKEAEDILYSIRENVENNLSLCENYGFRYASASINAIRFFRVEAAFFDINKLLASMKISRLTVSKHNLNMRFSYSASNFIADAAVELTRDLIPRTSFVPDD